MTTHSSQLLDCFTIEEIKSNVSLLLLTKNPAEGTKVRDLRELSDTQEDLKEWMQDFGIGGAVYHSGLLDKYCQSGEEYAGASRFSA